MSDRLRKATRKLIIERRLTNPGPVKIRQLPDERPQEDNAISVQLPVADDPLIGSGRRGDSSPRLVQRVMTLHLRGGHLVSDMDGSPRAPPAASVSASKRMESGSSRRSDSSTAEGSASKRRSSLLMSGFNVTEFITDNLLKLYHQNQGKQINADQDVLSSYHDSFLYGRVPFNDRVRGAVYAGHIAALLRVMEFLCALTSVSIYLRSLGESTSEEVAWVKTVQAFITIFFLVDYVLKCYSSPVIVSYLISIDGIVDLASTLPVIFFFTNDKRNATIPQLFMFLRMFRVIPYVLKTGLIHSTVMQQILHLVGLMLGLVFMAAGIFQWVESRNLNCNAVNVWCPSFYESLYFIIVTVATVGYGDISPKTTWGRLVVILLIISAITIVPGQIGKILELAARRPYGGRFDARKALGSRYIILSGHLTFGSIQTFLAEFYHPQHATDHASYPLRVVIMAPFKPTFEMKTLIGLYGGFVEFIEGSPLQKDDLYRTSAHAATAFYLLANQNAEDAEMEDQAQMIRALSVHRFCTSRKNMTRKARIIVQMLTPENRSNAVWDEGSGHQIEVICTEDLRYQLLARSCAVTGLSTLVMNLLSSGLLMSQLAAHKRHKHPEMFEYYKGMQNEIYPVLLPPLFHELRFEEAAEFVYRYTGSILFGLDIPIEDEGRASRFCLMSPYNHIIQEHDVGLVIARDIRAAQMISRLLRPQERAEGCWSCKRKQQGDGDVEKATAAPADRTICFCFKLKKEDEPRWEEVEALVAEIREGWRARMGDSLTFQTKLDSDVDSTSINEVSLTPDDRQHMEARAVARSNTDAASPAQSSSAGGSNHGSSGKRVTNSELMRRASEGSGGQRALNSHLRMVISQAAGAHEGITGLKENWTKQGILSTQLSCMSESPCSPQRSAEGGLERIIEKLLQWPPRDKFVKPDRVVLERREAVILENLRVRTLTSTIKLKEQHILICIQNSWPENLFYLLAHLRLKRFYSLPVVILSPQQPSAPEWGCLGLFDDVFFIKGSPVFELDLICAGVLQAEKVLLLAGRSPAQPDGDEHSDNELVALLSDITNVTVAATIEAQPGVKSNLLLVELQHDESFQFLNPKFHLDEKYFQRAMYDRNRSGIHRFALPYQAGKAFAPMFLNFVLHATFYNKNIVSIIQQLIRGGPVEDMAGEDDDVMRQLDIIEMPEEYVKKSFEELFLGLLHTKMLAIGLFRVGSRVGYVYTNPENDTVCDFLDHVYVLK